MECEPSFLFALMDRCSEVSELNGTAVIEYLSPVAALQGGSRDGPDPRGPLLRLDLREQPLLLAGRLRDAPHGQGRTQRYFIF